MARNELLNTDYMQAWTLDGNDQWTDPLTFVGFAQEGRRQSAALIVEGSFTGTPVVQARRPAFQGQAAGAWVPSSLSVMVADTPDTYFIKVAGQIEVRAGFATLSGSSTLTLTR